jgi:hypothetical protein
MKQIKIKRLTNNHALIKPTKSASIPILNDKGQIVYVTEKQFDKIIEKQRQGLEELRGIWEDKDDSFFDLGGK